MSGIVLSLKVMLGRFTEEQAVRAESHKRSWVPLSPHPHIRTQTHIGIQYAAHQISQNNSIHVPEFHTEASNFQLHPIVYK